MQYVSIHCNCNELHTVAMAMFRLEVCRGWFCFLCIILWSSMLCSRGGKKNWLWLRLADNFEQMCSPNHPLYYSQRWHSMVEWHIIHMQYMDNFNTHQARLENSIKRFCLGRRILYLPPLPYPPLSHRLSSTKVHLHIYAYTYHIWMYLVHGAFMNGCSYLYVGWMIWILLFDGENNDDVHICVPDYVPWHFVRLSKCTQ